VRLVSLLACVLLLVGCSAPDGSVVAHAPASAPAFDQSTPQAAVRSYLDGITYSYRIGVSDVASQTMSGAELVRVDAYIELNRQQGRSIEQTLTEIEFGSVTGVEPTLTVEATENWVYRYVPADGAAADSEELDAAYATEYTVIREGELWRVDSVKVQTQGTVK